MALLSLLHNNSPNSLVSSKTRADMEGLLLRSLDVRSLTGATARSKLREKMLRIIKSRKKTMQGGKWSTNRE
jgi:hypothetical protein